MNPSLTESAEKAAQRFTLELEFVQLFADPSYVHFLARQAYLTKPAFIKYLEYLYDTWSTPAYVCHMLYPQCLASIRCILMDEDYRKAIMSSSYAELLKKEQIDACLGEKPRE
jgi:mediator of RNA polymerase II transcription subunit 31